MTVIETDRLTIRNFHADDWHDLHEMIVRYQASEYAQYDHQWPTATEEIKGVAEWFASGDSYLAVCLKATGKLIGFIALNPGEKQDDPEFGLGYVFNPDYHGKGYATEGCRAILDHAFGQLAADRVITGTAAANHLLPVAQETGLQGDGPEHSFFQGDTRRVPDRVCRSVIRPHER